MQKTKAEQRSETPGVCPPIAPSFLGLLGDHVARGSHRTAAVGFLFLSRFQNLQVEEDKKVGNILWNCSTSITQTILHFSKTFQVKTSKNYWQQKTKLGPQTHIDGPTLTVDWSWCLMAHSDQNAHDSEQSVII